MPDLQINPLYSALESLSEDSDLSPFKLLAIQENDVKFLPLSVLNLGGGSSWKALAFQVSNVSAVSYVHIRTLQTLTDMIFCVFRESVSSKCYVGLNIPEWDNTTTTAVTYYDVNILSGANRLVNTGDTLTLRADAHAQPEIDGIQRFRIAGSLVPAEAFLLLLYKGAIETPALYVEIIPE